MRLVPFMPTLTGPDAPAFRAGFVSSLSIEPLQMRVPMDEQRYAPIQNATTLPLGYPDEPSLALTASMKLRRDQLLGFHTEQAPTDRPITSITDKVPRMGAFEPEVRLG